MRRTILGCCFVVLLSVGCSDDERPQPQGGGGSAPTTATTSTSTSASVTTSITSSASATSSSTSSQGGGGAGGGPTCDPYPVELSFPDNQAAALAELATIAPDATMTWSAIHGTPQSVNDINVTLDCAGNGDDAWNAAWAFIGAHPTLFELDRTEWAPTSPLPCSVITPGTLVNTYRTGLAGIGVKKDVLAIYISPIAGGGVNLQTVSGFYLPVVAAGDIPECDDAPDSVDEAAIRAMSYPFATFDQCIPSGSGSYTPHPNDVIEYDDTWWEWEDETAGVSARKYRQARLIIDPSNYTSQLMASDLNCPDPSSDDVRILGYTITLDAITGEVLDVIPGIGCIVC